MRPGLARPLRHLWGGPHLDLPANLMPSGTRVAGPVSAHSIRALRPSRGHGPRHERRPAASNSHGPAAASCGWRTPAGPPRVPAGTAVMVPRCQRAAADAAELLRAVT